MCCTSVFLSTLSLRRATASSSAMFSRTAISIHALLAESDTLETFERPISESISIHALLAESDYIRPLRFLFYEISIHALLAESDDVHLYEIRVDESFLSTLSLRRATGQRSPGRCPFAHFYPRSPCGERLAKAANLSYILIISIHALLAESDSGPSRTSPCVVIFLSTLSLRRATAWKYF